MLQDTDMQEIQGIIFDFDGTLVDSIPAHKKIVQEIARRHRFTVPDEEFDKYNGMSAKEGLRNMLRDAGKRITPILVIQLLREKAQAQRRIIEETRIYPQTHACLQRLKEYKLAVATSSERDYLNKLLQKFGMQEHFDALLSKNDIRRAKPAPDIFLKAAAKIGKHPNSCAVIEDSINGIIAAKRAGMASIALLTTTPRELFAGAAEPDLIINNLDELDKEALEKAESKFYIRQQLEDNS